MMLLFVIGPYLVTFALALSLCEIWHLLLHEWPNTTAVTILTIGVGFVTAYNWPAKWRFW